MPSNNSIKVGSTVLFNLDGRHTRGTVAQLDERRGTAKVSGPDGAQHTRFLDGLHLLAGG